MTTERLFEFAVLAQTLSYSLAARKLFMSQSTLSRHVMEMEDELGVALLERTTHSVRLTEGGRLLARGAKGLLQKYEAALSRLRVAELQVSGTVSIACMESAMFEQLLAFMRQFMAKYSEIDCRIEVLGGGGHLDILEQHDFLFTAFELQKPPPGVAGIVAFRDPGVLAALPDQRQIGNHQIGLEELAGQTLLVPYADEMFCSYAANRQLTEKLTRNMVNVVKVSTVESALVMTALGKGVAIVPQHLVSSTIRDTWIIGITTPGCVFDTYLYWNQARADPAARLMFEEFQSFMTTQL